MRKGRFTGILLCFMVLFLQCCNSDSLWNWLHSPDLFYLEVLETIPGENDSDISLNSEIIVTLNDNVDPTTITSGNFFLDNAITPLSINYDNVNKKITFIPDSPLLSATTYCATLTTDVKTLVGETFDEPYQWCFTTVNSDQPEIEIKVDDVPVENDYVYDFGLLEINETRIVTVEVINSGTADLTIGAVVPEGSNADRFTVDLSGFVTLLPADASSSFEVAYTSSSAGTHTAMIAIPTNDISENPFTLNLTGESLVSVQPEITLLQGSTVLPYVDGIYDFGTVQTGNTSQVVTFTILNSGSDNLSIDSIVLGDKNADEFILNTSGMLTSLLPGEDTDFSVTFSPLGLGTKKGEISITSNDPVHSPAVIRVKGRGY